MKTALCLGGNGFVCHYLARRLKSEGYFVRVVDIKEYEYGDPYEFCHENLIYDLRDPRNVEAVMRLDYFPGHEGHDDVLQPFSYYQIPYSRQIPFDEVYQLGADMGGSQFVFTGEHDADIMHNSALINLNVAAWAQIYGVKKLFYSSSACMYPQQAQNPLDPNYYHDETIEFHKKMIECGLSEDMAYPADPDSEYGWEKLFSERLYLAYARNYGLNVRIARFHNIYGPEGTYKGGREKAPAAMCRKVIEQSNSKFNSRMEERGYESNLEISVWGDGQQTRSFLYINDCIDAVRLLMESDFKEPINIGSEEMVSINELARMAIEFSGKDIAIKNVPSNALGVRGRNSDNTLIRKVLGWEPKYSLKQGLEITYKWIKSMYEKDSR